MTFYANAEYIIASALKKEQKMFNFEDYTKNFEKMMSQSPIKIDDAMKSLMDYNSKFGKIALDTVKKNTELS